MTDFDRLLIIVMAAMASALLTSLSKKSLSGLIFIGPISIFCLVDYIFLSSLLSFETYTLISSLIFVFSAIVIAKIKSNIAIPLAWLALAASVANIAASIIHTSGLDTLFYQYGFIIVYGISAFVIGNDNGKWRGINMVYWAYRFRSLRGQHSIRANNGKTT